MGTRVVIKNLMPRVAQLPEMKEKLPEQPRSNKRSNRKSKKESPEHSGNDDKTQTHQQNKRRSLQAQHARNTESPRDRKGPHRQSSLITRRENGDYIRMIWKRVRGQTGKGAFPPETGGI